MRMTRRGWNSEYAYTPSAGTPYSGESLKRLGLVVEDEDREVGDEDVDDED